MKKLISLKSLTIAILTFFTYCSLFCTASYNSEVGVPNMVLVKGGTFQMGSNNDDDDDR